MRGGLCTILADGENTGGSYIVIEQMVRRGRVNTTHVFDDGEIVLLLDQKVRIAIKQALVFMPREHVSAVSVISNSAHCFNITTPGRLIGMFRLLARLLRRKSLHGRASGIKSLMLG